MIKHKDLDNRAVLDHPRAELTEAEHALVAALPHPAVAELAALREREAAVIAAVRALRPPKGIADGRAWSLGRDAALAVLLRP